MFGYKLLCIISVSSRSTECKVIPCAFVQKCNLNNERQGRQLSFRVKACMYKALSSMPSIVSLPKLIRKYGAVILNIKYSTYLKSGINIIRTNVICDIIIH